MRKQNKRNVAVLVGLLLSQVLLGATYTDKYGVQWTYTGSQIERVSEVSAGTVYLPERIDGVEMTVISTYLPESKLYGLKGLGACDLIVPSTIAKVCETSFGGDSSYGEMYPSKLNSVFFQGDVPDVSYESYKLRSTTFNASTKIYYVYGNESWSKLSKWEGGTVEPGAAKVTLIASETDNGTVVRMQCLHPDAAIYYTLDGSEPSVLESGACHLYTGEILITKNVKVRAIAHVEGYPYTLTTTGAYAMGTVAMPRIACENAAFEGAPQKVTIACDTDCASIYYTLDGSEPGSANGLLYREPFVCNELTEVRAIAIKKDWLDSAESKLIVKRYGGEVTLWRNISGETKTEVANGVTWTYSPFDEEGCGLYDFSDRTQNLQPVITSAGDIVRIPDFLDGKPVVAIGRMAFTGCNINTLIIPRGIKELD